MGIPLVHYEIRPGLSYDPLFRCDHLKWTVTRNDSLPVVIETINSLSDDEFSRQVDLATDYLSKYFHPVTEKDLRKFIYSSDGSSDG